MLCRTSSSDVITKGPVIVATDKDKKNMKIVINLKAYSLVVPVYLQQDHEFTESI